MMNRILLLGIAACAAGVHAQDDGTTSGMQTFSSTDTTSSTPFYDKDNDGTTNQQQQDGSQQQHNTHQQNGSQQQHGSQQQQNTHQQNGNHQQNGSQQQHGSQQQDSEYQQDGTHDWNEPGGTWVNLAAMFNDFCANELFHCNEIKNKLELTDTSMTQILEDFAILDNAVNHANEAIAAGGDLEGTEGTDNRRNFDDCFEELQYCFDDVGSTIQEHFDNVDDALLAGQHGAYDANTLMDTMANVDINGNGDSEDDTFSLDDLKENLPESQQQILEDLINIATSNADIDNIIN